MSVIGTNVAQSLAGLNQAERAESREKAAKPVPRPRVRGQLKDELELQVAAPESADAVHNPVGTGQEETPEDHQRSPSYSPAGKKPSPDDQPKLDIQG
jgi:hypothetical protein